MTVQNEALVENDGFNLSSLLDIASKFGQFLLGKFREERCKWVWFENITHCNVGARFAWEPAFVFLF
jgi:hypothetical protein